MAPYWRGRLAADASAVGSPSPARGRGQGAALRPQTQPQASGSGPRPRWLAAWRRNCDGYEITGKAGTAAAIADGVGPGRHIARHVIGMLRRQRGYTRVDVVAGNIRLSHVIRCQEKSL